MLTYVKKVLLALQMCWRSPNFDLPNPSRAILITLISRHRIYPCKISWVEKPLRVAQAKDLNMETTIALD
ncbi:hypothetical protein H0H92_004661 [Tricholoma furcatifolium]|nr:hypothetical protein H0H92_004661 [Tricholoma furcatifolium]